jgi:hypothetical protein
MPDLEDDKIAKLLAERGVDTKRILALINGWFGTEAGPVQEDPAGGRMGKDCVDNAHKADWIREMNAMEHDCDEVRKDNRFNLTGWPYEVEESAIPCGRPIEDPLSKAQVAFAKTTSPYKAQVGGDHYSKYAIQPTEYIIKNKLNFCEGNVVKYVTRWRDKGGVDDLRKAKHYIDMLIETEGL